VNRLKEYSIPFVGLEPGNHQFEFEVNDSFFEHFEFSQIQHAQIHVTVVLEKMERMMVFTIGIKGEALVTCDRCTGEFNFPVSDTQRLIVKLGAEYKFDLSTYIYEFIHLALPVRLLHPDDDNGNSTCDPDMLRILETLAPAADTFDPRWEALKRLNTDQ
jgi:uncharacterized metal-binding protein YceD (DUF177 family)